MILEKAADFPIDLASCKVFDAEPMPYFSSQTGAYYMIYEYEGYKETSELADQGVFYDYPQSQSFFSDCVVANFTGKNLFICLWYENLDTWKEDMDETEIEKSDSIIKEYSRVSQIMLRKAFDKKTVILTGEGANWEVKMPIEYILNKRTNEQNFTETVFLSKGKTLLKYLNQGMFSGILQI